MAIIMHAKLVFLLGAFILQRTSAIVNVDLSKPALQKCENSKLGHWDEDIAVPSHRMSNGENLTFRVTEKCPTRLPHCMTSCQLTMLQVPMPLSEPYPINNKTGPQEQTPIMHFTPKGYLRVEDQYFSPDDFCLSDIQNNNLILQVCPSICSNNKKSESEICVQKCCTLHKVLDLRTGTCEDSTANDLWAPLVYRSADRQVCGEKRSSLKLSYMQKPPINCIKFQAYLLKDAPGTPKVRFRLLTNGSLLLRDISDVKWTLIPKNAYCLDAAQNYDGVKDKDKPYSGDPTDQTFLHCIQEDEVSSKYAHSKETNHSEDRLNFTGISYIVLLFSGVPFLLITAIAYMLVFNKQNVHGWTIFSHTLAMLLHYLGQAVANTVSRILNSNHSHSSLCRIVGISNHFFVLAAFCWLTIINYDLFSMFRHLKTTIGRSRGLKRFLVYMAIGWGIPFLTVLISVILDKLYGLYGDDGDCEADVIVPLYGYKTCYMVEEARPFYLYYPVGFLMCLNLILAGMTFFNMYKHDESAKMANEENRTKHRRKFSVMAKLFIVMGLAWVFEVIVFMLLKKEWETLPWYLVFPDVFNALQAVAIFILFACQPKILNQVSESYPRLQPITEMMKSLSCSKKQVTTTGSTTTSLAGGIDKVSKKIKQPV